MAIQQQPQDKYNNPYNPYPNQQQQYMYNQQYQQQAPQQYHTYQQPQPQQFEQEPYDPRLNVDQQTEFYYDQQAYNPQVNPVQQFPSSEQTDFNDQWVEAPIQVEPAVSLLLNLFLPGLGHVIIGQVEKGLFYLISSVIASTIVGILFVVLIGLYCIPVLVFFQIVIMIDGFKIAQRMKTGYRVMKGECASKWAAIGLKLFLKGPVFVNTNFASAPIEWQVKTREFENMHGIQNHNLFEA